MLKDDDKNREKRRPPLKPLSMHGLSLDEALKGAMAAGSPSDDAEPEEEASEAEEDGEPEKPKEPAEDERAG